MDSDVGGERNCRGKKPVIQGRWPWWVCGMGGQRSRSEHVQWERPTGGLKPPDGDTPQSRKAKGWPVGDLDFQERPAKETGTKRLARSEEPKK